jgi:crotonobetaine/carnitine-CoA ligase
MRDDEVEALRRLPPSDQTLGALLERQAAAYPDRVLLRDEDGDCTYAEMRDAAARLAATLAGHGVERGERIAALTDRAIPLVELWLACAWLGAVLVPLNTETRGPRLAHALTDSEARILVIDHELVVNVEGLDGLPEVLAHVWVIGNLGEAGPAHLGRASLGPVPAQDEAIERCVLGPMDPAAIIYTSGTTARRRGWCVPTPSGCTSRPTRSTRWASSGATSSTRACPCSTSTAFPPSSRR